MMLGNLVDAIHGKTKGKLTKADIASVLSAFKGEVIACIGKKESMSWNGFLSLKFQERNFTYKSLKTGKIVKGKRVFANLKLAKGLHRIKSEKKVK